VQDVEGSTSDKSKARDVTLALALNAAQVCWKRKYSNHVHFDLLNIGLRNPKFAVRNLTSKFNEQARLKLKDEMVEAAANCSLALAIDPSNVKALFRRGQAHLLKGDFDLCKQDLQKALSLEPANNDVIQELKRCDAAAMKARKAEKELYGKMFG